MNQILNYANISNNVVRLSTNRDILNSLILIKCPLTKIVLLLQEVNLYGNTEFFFQIDNFYNTTYESVIIQIMENKEIICNKII